MSPFSSKFVDFGHCLVPLSCALISAHVNAGISLVVQVHCCFTSVVTVRTIKAQNDHLDLHTAPGLSTVSGGASVALGMISIPLPRASGISVTALNKLNQETRTRSRDG